MPQPLSRVSPKPNLSFGTDSLNEYPNLAVLITQCISSISWLDHTRGKILSELLSGEVHAALSMFSAISSSSAKEAALDAAAQSSLDERELAVFQLVVRKSKSAIRTRNKFAHGLWGHSADIENALFLASSADYGQDSEEDLMDQMSAYIQPICCSLHEGE